MRKLPSTFIFMESDPAIPFSPDEDPSFKVSRAATPSTGWEHLHTRFSIIDEVCNRVVTYRVIHHLEARRLEAEGPDSDELREKPFVTHKEFRFHHMTDRTGIFQGSVVDLRRMYSRIASNGHNIVIRTRQVNLESLEASLKDIDTAQTNIRGYGLGEFRLGGVRKAKIQGDTLDEDRTVQALTGRSVRKSVQFSIRGSIGDTTITVRETGEIVMNRDIGEAPSLEFVIWLNDILDRNSALTPLRSLAD